MLCANFYQCVRWDTLLCGFLRCSFFFKSSSSFVLYFLVSPLSFAWRIDGNDERVLIISFMSVCVPACMNVCVYWCMCVCVCVRVYTSMCIYFIPKQRRRLQKLLQPRQPFVFSFDGTTHISSHNALWIQDESFKHCTKQYKVCMSVCMYVCIQTMRRTYETLYAT